MVKRKPSKARRKQMAIHASKKKKRTSPKRKATKTTIKKSSGNKKPFGGYTINFKGRNESVEQVFGSKPIPPSQMTKKIWTFVKAKKLGNK